MTDVQGIATLITTTISAIVTGYLAIRRQADGRRLKQHSGTLAVIKKDVNSNTEAANNEIKLLRKEARDARNEVEKYKKEVVKLETLLGRRRRKNP